MLKKVYCEKFYTETIKKLSSVKKMINRCPKGVLKSSPVKVKGHTYERFYALISYCGKNRRVWIKKNSERLTAFAEKAYWEEMARRTEKNCAFLKACAEGLLEDDANSVLSALDPNIAKYVNAEKMAGYEAILCSENFEGGRNAAQKDGMTATEKAKEHTAQDTVLTDRIAERIRKWRDDTRTGNYERLTEHAESLRHKATNGLTVRSKSEAAIVEILLRFGQTVRYEWSVETSGGKLHPDFAIMRDDGQIIFWEHFGKMNDSRYIENMHKKLAAYEAAGIVPWKNLIITYDSEDGDIDLLEVESAVRNKLLR